MDLTPALILSAVLVLAFTILGGLPGTIITDALQSILIITGITILAASCVSFAGGAERVKLYFMMGLPTETEEDLKSILDIADRALGYARKYKRRGDVSISEIGRAHV